MAEDEEKSECDHLLVAAFDFGTTFSGYAFSFRDQPSKIQTNLGWNAGSEKLISLKTPTRVLLDPDKKFNSFGFDAEISTQIWQKMANIMGLNRGATVEDINGKTMPAMTIFAMSIRYLREHLLKALDTQMVGLEEKDIQYVVTVPAIWNDKAKQFMREAAIEAGMQSDRVKLALEPEAASIWCQTVTTGLRSELSKSGKQYMVVDLGGGTADVSVHEKKPDGSLKEIHKASGGPWGGSAVDENYLRWLKQIFGEKAIDKFKETEMADYFDVLREFETKKRNILPNTDGLITFKVAASLREIHEKQDGQGIQARLAALGLGEKVTSRGDKLRVHASIAKEWFAGPIKGTIDHINRLLSEPKMSNLGNLLLVGGFGECQLVQDAIKTQIRNKRLIVPNEAGLAVLKGAVRFGHLPKIVSARILRYTYGIQTNIEFDEDKHPLLRKKIMQGSPRLDGVFAKFVEANTEMKIGNVVSKAFYPADPLRTGITIFTSTDPNPFLVFDKECREIGFLDIAHPEGRNMEDKDFEVNFEFGETELKVSIKFKNIKREYETAIDCL